VIFYSELVLNVYDIFSPVNCTYHGSNSCMMLSNRITANRREANPESQASIKTVIVIKLFHPEL